jgi:hypothetical protein
MPNCSCTFQLSLDTKIFVQTAGVGMELMKNIGLANYLMAITNDPQKLGRQWFLLRYITTELHLFMRQSLC